MTLRLPRLAIGPVLGLLLVAVSVQGCNDPPAAKPADHAPRHGKVAIIGDSYMAGTDPTDLSTGMAVRVAEDLGMNLVNFSVGGTGYLRGGLTGTWGYGAQADLAAKSKADLFVVYGGANDFIDIYPDGPRTLDDLAAAAREVFSTLEGGAGKADVVVVGPIWPAVPPDDRALAIRDVLQREAEAAGFAFVDPIAEQWLTADNLEDLIGPDNVHPSPAGSNYFAQRVADAVQAVR